MLAGVSIDITAELQREQALNLALQQKNALARELEQANALLLDQATTDALTGLRNRRSFDDRLRIELARATRRHRPLSLILFDVDNFKRRNDLWGHDAGDAVLRQIGVLLKTSIRTQDFGVRYGGEEFAVLLPDTREKEALHLAERIRATIAGGQWEHEPVTVSLGVSMLHPHVQRAEDLVRAADESLYVAKRAGKNCVRYSKPGRSRWGIDAPGGASAIVH